MATGDLIQFETDWAIAYRCLADAFHLPDEALSETLEQLESAIDRLNSSAIDAVRCLRQSWNKTGDLSALKVAYARLFSGPFPVLAPPYGSIYLEDGRRTMGDSSLNVQAFYLEAGLDLSGHFKDAPDHIAAELEFMHVLVCREIDAIRKNDDASVRENIRRQDRFIRMHLGAWTPAFTALVIEHGETPFYRELAMITRLFIKEEMNGLADFRGPEPIPVADPRNSLA